MCLTRQLVGEEDHATQTAASRDRAGGMAQAFVTQCPSLPRCNTLNLNGHM